MTTITTPRTVIAATAQPTRQPTNRWRITVFATTSTVLTAAAAGAYHASTHDQSATAIGLFTVGAIAQILGVITATHTPNKPPTSTNTRGEEV